MNQVFSLSSLLVMPFWFLIAFLPTWKWTKRIISSLWVAAPAALLYVVLVVPNFIELLPQMLNPELANITVLLGTPEGTTIAWVHFLCFDLFVGRWVYLDSRQRALHPVLMFPFIFFTLMFGPLGFLAYLVLRSAAGKKISS